VDPEDPQSIQPDVERRRGRRISLAAQVHCEALERKEIMETRNVSLAGMFLNAKFPLPIDSDLSLTFQLKPTEPAITCGAKVMFARVGVGMGIEFVDLSAEARQLIQNFVEEAC
jgi:hypothetical protein